LANDLGNLLSRTLNMIEKYFGGQVPGAGGRGAGDEGLSELIRKTPQEFDRAMEQLAFSAALEAVWQLISQANGYIEKQAPWALAKKGETDQLALVMRTLYDTLKVVSDLIVPFMPATAVKMAAQLSPPGDKVTKGEPLFPRIAKSTD
jgi:methionyl-tRNA synthetase